MTNDQANALRFLDAWFATTKRGTSAFACLEGYAGTGKTWLIAYWVERLLEDNPELRITVVAPTNKAVDVLRAKCGHLPVDFRTLDSYLGFRIKRDDDWKMQRSRSTKAADADTPDLVICDEGSMVKKEYRQELAWRDVPVLFVGDPAQLAPVGEEKSCVFDEPERATLLEIVRQAEGNPIIELSAYLRHRVEDGQWFTLQDIRAFAKEGDRRIAFTNARNVYDWAEAAIDKGMDCRILAFTNAAVYQHNAAMHKRRHPDAPLFGAGELALVNEAFDYDDETLLCNGELLKVLACEPAEPICGVEVFTVRAKRLANSLEVDGEGVGKELLLTVPLDAEQAVRVHRQMTDRIYELRREGRMGDAEKMMVERRPLNKLAPLRHSYACTVHKSQGSTYDVAFLDFPDIYRSRDMRARLLYVAATRPSQYLVVSHTGA